VRTIELCYFNRVATSGGITSIKRFMVRVDENKINSKEGTSYNAVIRTKVVKKLISAFTQRINDLTD
jgi:hypothetical protein